MGPIGCPETSVRHHHYSLHNNPEKLSSQSQHLFQTATVHCIQSLCLVLPCYMPVVRNNSRTFHRPNVTLHDSCLCFPPKHLLARLYLLPLCSPTYYDIKPDCQLWAKKFVRQSIRVASFIKVTWLWMSLFIYCYVENSMLKPRDVVNWSFVNSTGDKQTTDKPREPM